MSSKYSLTLVNTVSNLSCSKGKLSSAMILQMTDKVALKNNWST
eukprot:14115.XXX_191978_192109_1 [CDS] Oithona nana genome sequencing.